MDVIEEARHLNRIFVDQPIQLVQYLSHQIATVKTYAQVLIGLCGLTITVTGFSGAHMIRSGSLASGLMVGGIALVMVGLVTCIRTVTRLRWVSQDLRDDLRETVEIVLRRRNLQQRAVSIAAVFVAGGLGCYLGAVTVAALVGGNLGPP
ncbi:MAG TPA: hypothetical protein VHE35_09950 [Kofleriaceae bacterium]|nr:hypothetical protein [Kofleriaceae bacterium]